MSEARFLSLGRNIISNQQPQKEPESNSNSDSFSGQKLSHRHKIAGFKSLQFDKENSALASNYYDNSLSSKGQDYFINSQRYSNHTDPRSPQIFNLDSKARSNNALPRIVPPQQQIMYSPQPVYYPQSHGPMKKNTLENRNVLTNVQPLFNVSRAQAINNQYYALSVPQGYTQPYNSVSTSQYYNGFDTPNLSSNISSQRPSMIYPNHELNEQGWLYPPVTKSQLLSHRSPGHFNLNARSQGISSLDISDGRFGPHPELQGYYENQYGRNPRNSIETTHLGGTKSLHIIDGDYRAEESDYLSLNSHRLKSKKLEPPMKLEGRSKSFRLAQSDGKKSLHREASSSKNDTSVIINHDYDVEINDAESDFSIFADSDSSYSPPRRKKHRSKSKRHHERKHSKRKSTIKVTSSTKADKTSARKPLEIRKLLKIHLWVMVYGNLVLRDTHHRVRRRKTTVRKTILDTYTAFHLDAQKFFLDYAGTHIRALYQEKKSMGLAGVEKKGFFGSKSLSQKEIENRVQNLIMPKLRALLNALINQITPETFPRSLSNFIASISENQCTPPDRFLFDFEIRRLGFTHFGTLKNMTELHSKMIIGMFLLVRVLIYQFLVSPWKELKDVMIGASKDDPITKNNLKNIASIFYHVVMDLFRGKVPVINNNQVFLTAELKIRPKIERLKTEENAEENIKSQDEDVIQGLYTKKELASFFSEHPQDVNQLKGLVEELLKSVYKLTHQNYLDAKVSSRTDIE